MSTALLHIQYVWKTHTDFRELFKGLMTKDLQNMTSHEYRWHVYANSCPNCCRIWWMSASVCKHCLWITHERATTQLFCINSRVSLMINQSANTINWEWQTRRAALQQINVCCLPCYRLKTLSKTYGGTTARARDHSGRSGATWGQLVVTQTHRKRKKHWVGPVAGARFLEGEYGGFESVFVLEWEGTSCFSSVSQKDGQWPAGTPHPPSPSPAWQLNSDGRSAEQKEIPADVRAALNGQVCPLFSAFLFSCYSVNYLIHSKLEYTPLKKVWLSILKSL